MPPQQFLHQMLLPPRARRRPGRCLAGCLFVGCSIIVLMLAYRSLERWLIHAAEDSNNDEDDHRDPAAGLAALRGGGIGCGQVQSMFPGRIPPVVHWTNRDEWVLQRHQELLLSWPAVLGASAAYMLWDDAKIERLLQRHYPALWQRYKLLGAGIMRSDIGRLAVVHHVGGVYTDMDVQLLRNFLPLLRNHTSLWSQEPLEHAQYLYNKPRLLSNAIFMSCARHQFLSYVLNAWPAWFDANWARQPGGQLRNPGSAVAMTGPLMLDAFLDDYERSGRPGRPSLAAPSAFQPRWDSGPIAGIIRRRCAFLALPVEKRSWCRQHRLNNFKPWDIPAASYAVHMYLHTGYGGSLDYTGARAFGLLLNASSCVI